MDNSPPAIAALYTATQIARALGMKRQALQRLLGGIAPRSRVLVSGNVADAWAVSDLPACLQSELVSRAQHRHGFRSVEHFLSAASQRWEPPMPLSEVAQHCVDKAEKLQSAFRNVLAKGNDLAVSTAELESIGLADYQKEFGHSITARHLRGLVKRTRDRDGGAGEFNRLELYLDDRVARKNPLPSKPRPGDEVEFRELRDVLAKFKQATAPTDGELQYFWLRAFEIYEARVADGKPAKRTRRALVRFLFAVLPALAKHEAALRNTFKRKLARWQENEQRIDSLADKRAENSGFHRAPELKAEDRDAIIAHALLNCDGRVSQAWRELSGRRALSEDLLGYYLSNPASKSYCPTRIREAVKYEVGMMEDLHHGPRQDKLNGAHIIRDWSRVAPLDWICGDDATLEVYFYTEDGKGGFNLMRGQFLVFICARTLRVLGFALLPDRNYNARVIKTAIVKICDEHGLPRKGFYFEGAIWKNSRILKGDPNADPISWPEAELGLRSLGLKFVHSRLPRSKPVERVIGALQDLMEGEPGYVGPDEKREKYERVQRVKLLVERGEVHPSEHFYTLDQWEARLAEICEQYNATKQDGKMTCGLSPDEAFEKFERRDDPPIKLPAGCRYLLAQHKSPVKVTSNGITLRFGKQVYNYRNEQTGRLRGQTLLGWFNPELPEILSVTDMNRENAFCVERTQEVPAMDAPPELLEQEFERINEHMSYARVRYRTLKARFSVPFRRTFADNKTVMLGVEISEQQNKIEARRADDQKRQTRVSKRARDFGIRPGLVENSDRSQSALDLMAEARREHERELTSSDIEETESNATPPAKPGKKIYQLKSYGGGQREYVDYLVKRLTEFRASGQSFGQSFGGKPSGTITKKIARSQLGFELYDVARFDEVCRYLKTKIDATILGKRNTAKGSPNYHEFEPAGMSATKGES
jgi:hypothetical protein